MIKNEIYLINDLIEKIDSGRNYNRKILKDILGPDLVEIEVMVADEKLYWSTKPKKIVEYSDLIRRGLINYSIGNKHSLKGEYYKSRKSFHKAESIFENAVEFLYEAIDNDSNLRLWIDRDLTNRNEIDFCPEGIPRPIWSKGNNKQYKIQRITKKQLILFKLEEKLDKIEGKDVSDLMDFNFDLKVTNKKRDFSSIKV